MIERSNETVALFLMRMAAALMDRAGLPARHAANHLRLAIELTEAAFDQKPNRSSSGTPTMNASAACDPSEQSQ